MTKNQYTKEFKEQIVKEVGEAKNVSIVAKKHNISSKSIHNWMRSRSVKNTNLHLKENKKLKKELEESKLELLILKDLLKKTYQR